MTPTVGIDFDNTIVSYDALMRRAAVDRALIAEAEGRTQTKKDVRDLIRQLPDGEIEWQKLQALVYGPMMRDAQPVEGAGAFIRRCRAKGIPVFIVSHKTEFASYDSTRTNLREAALEWMDLHRFFDADGLNLTRDHVFFESTRSGKVERIRRIGCSHFIDDLEEVFLEPSFPADVEKILYDPQASAPASANGVRRMASWQALCDDFFNGRP
jgi:hypothetical protein